VDGLQFAALYTLQDGLAGDAEPLCGLDHGDEAQGRFLDEAAEEVISDADLPRGPWRGLFRRNEAVLDPAQHSGGRQVQHFGRFADGERFAVRGSRRSLPAGDAAMMAQGLNMPGGKAIARGRSAALPVQDAGDDAIGMMDGETTDDVDGFVIGSPRRGIGARQGNL